jgi:MGT family glycosyltransferase
MSHIGIIPLPAPSHVTTLAALGRELKQRNHEVTVFGLAEIETRVQRQGLKSITLGDRAAENQLITQNDRLRADLICRYAPDTIKQANIDLLLVDQIEPAGGSVAEFLNLPFVTVCSALAINREPNIPPAFLPWMWEYQTTWQARLRNRIGYWLCDRIIQPINTVINQYREKWHLPPLRYADDSFSTLAQICQQPAEFDFPRQELPNYFHYTGTLRQSSPEAVPFPYEKLTGQPLIYASLGTELTGKEEVYEQIVQACQALDAQVVISYGGRKTKKIKSKLATNVLEVDYAPQIELLKRAKLTITHSGLNTVLESLAQGVPMVAIPIVRDAYAIASRIRWTGCGEVIPWKSLTQSQLNSAVKQVFIEDSYQHQAVKLANSIQQAGGVVKAADIVEQVLITGKAVLVEK